MPTQDELDACTKAVMEMDWADVFRRFWALREEDLNRYIYGDQRPSYVRSDMGGP